MGTRRQTGAVWCPETCIRNVGIKSRITVNDFHWCSTKMRVCWYTALPVLVFFQIYAFSKKKKEIPPSHGIINEMTTKIVLNCKKKQKICKITEQQNWNPRWRRAYLMWRVACRWVQCNAVSNVSVWLLESLLKDLIWSSPPHPQKKWLWPIAFKRTLIKARLHFRQ